MGFSKHFLATIATALLAVPALTFDSSAQTPPLIYGFMDESDEWRDLQDQAYSQYGFYTFRPDGSMPFTPVSSISADNEWANDGAVYADGKYYCYSVNGTWMKYTLNFKVLDANTWKVVASNSFTYTYGDAQSEESQKAYLIPSDLAYDAINDVIYASVRRFNSDQMPMLCTVDKATGVLTRIASIPNMAALTADATGQLYGIGLEDTKLYKVGKDGTATAIGATGWYPSRDRKLSATYDFTSGTIYWSFFGFSNSRDRNYNENAVWGMLKIDPATAEATMTWNYPRDQRFSSINIINAHPLAPADITDLSFLPDANESNNAVVTFTVPSKTASQTSISSNVDLTLTLDDEVYCTASAAPGSTFTRSITGLEPGNHTLAVDAVYNGRSGNRAYARTFFGVDVPEAVTNLVLTADESKTVATLTWDAPLLGTNGSQVDPSKIRYRIVRYPGEEVVKRSHAETTFTETIEHPYSRTSYVVTPYHVDSPGDLGKGRRSNYVMMGVDIEPPYSETFDTQSAFDTFTTIDVDGDGSDEWASPCWKYDYEYLCAFYYGRNGINANDWLITPPLKLDPDKLYKLTFQHYAYYGYGSHFQVWTGNAPTVEGMTTMIMDVRKTTTAYDTPGVKEEVIFAAPNAERYVGFVHLSQNMEHLSLDNIKIDVYGDARVPAKVNNLTATPIGDEELRLSFEMPSVTAAGKPLEGKLSAEIYRPGNSKPAATIKDLAPGAKVDWDDPDAIRGINTYIVVAVNNYGQGLESELTLDLTPARPESVTNAKARYINDRQVEITWEPSATAIADPSIQLRYLVFRIIPGENGPSYEIIGRDIADTRFVDDNPRYGLDQTCQQYVQYYVEPVTGSGEGYATLTQGATVGAAYTLPFSETWPYAAQESLPWLKGGNGATWYVVNSAYDPMAPAYDTPGMIRCECNYGESVGTATYISPRIDLTTKSNPKLTFAMWQESTYASDVALSVGVDVEGEGTTYTSTSFKAQSSEKGWKVFEVDLSKWANKKRVSIVLTGKSRADQNIHVDALKIDGSEITGAVAGAYIVGPADVREDQTETYEAFVANTSGAEVKNVAVEITDGSKTVANMTISSIAPNSVGSATFDFTPAASNVGKTTLAMKLKSGSTTFDASTATKELRVKAANYSTIHNLGAKVTQKGIELKWTAPTRTEQPAEEIDGFEAYTSFTIDSIGGWTTHDGDQFHPFRFADGNGGKLHWPNCEELQSFIVFNPGKLSVTTPFKPNAGQHMAISWGSPEGANNDWLISPELSGDAQLISFFASSVLGGDKEYFHILASSTDNRPESFMRISGKEPLTVTSSWELYHFALPEGTKYFAINYVGEKRDGIMIDDVMLHSYHNALIADGYNIYRDGVKLNDRIVTSRCWTDTDFDPADTYTYVVKPLFNGKEGNASNECEINPSALGVATAPGAPVVSAIAGAIVVDNAGSALVEVFTPDGKLIASTRADNHIEINMAPGIYIVKAGATKAKITVR